MNSKALKSKFLLFGVQIKQFFFQAIKNTDHKWGFLKKQHFFKIFSINLGDLLDYDKIIVFHPKKQL